MEKLVFPFVFSTLIVAALLQEPSEFLNIPYVAGGMKSQQLDVFVPPGSGPRPLVIWIHGGGWLSGSKEGGPWRALVDNGFVVASINYRFSNEARFPAQIEDCKAAVRFLRANAARFNIDKSRVGVWGASAGGHLAALLGTSGDVPALEGKLGNPTESSRVQAVCDWYGPVDLTTMRTGASAADVKNPEALLLGGSLATNMDKARFASPTTYISKDDPPFFILHGNRDQMVPKGQSEAFHRALQTQGVSSVLLIVPGAGHGNLGKDAQAKTVAFFRKILLPSNS